MRLPSKTDDSDAPPYPIETIRYWYVSPFGGRSDDLEEGQVGVNGTALARNTEIAPEDRVSVAIVGGGPERPWYFRETFEVVALDERTPVAAALSPGGEVVLPDPAFDFVRRPHLQPREGDPLMLKATAAKLMAEPSEWLAEFLRSRAGRASRQA